MNARQAVLRATVVSAAGILAACFPPTLRQGPATSVASAGAPIAELWMEPRNLADRNLLAGPGGAALAPSNGVTYKVVREDDSGYSPGFDVVDPEGREWDIKLGPEAQSEIVVSRILWAVGYHQSPTYYVTDWQLEGTWEDEGTPARFRYESGHDTEGEWEWNENPFAGTRALHGLVAVNLLLNNWDFKTSNNRIYKMREARQEPARRYVVQDLGASLGKSRTLLIGTRNDIDDFEEPRLIKEVRAGKVTLDHRGLNSDILERLSPADVVWACELVNRLSDAQLDDAFEAARYEPDVRRRFIQKIRAKIQEGLTLKSGTGAQG